MKMDKGFYIASGSEAPYSPTRDSPHGLRLALHLDTPAEFFFKITDGLILFSADIRINRIYADDRKFGWITAECVKIRLNYG